MSDVFISHIADDADIAMAIATGLEAAGYGTWYYEEHALPDSPYLIQIGKAIDRCKAIVLVISPASLGSNQMTTEVVRAHEAEKPFVPVLVGIAHSEFQSRQPLWRQAIGAATAVSVPPEGVAAIVPRIAAGLREMAIEPGETDAGAATTAQTPLSKPAPPTTAIPEPDPDPPALPEAEATPTPPPRRVRGGSRPSSQRWPWWRFSPPPTTSLRAPTHPSRPRYPERRLRNSVSECVPL